MRAHARRALAELKAENAAHRRREALRAEIHLAHLRRLYAAWCKLAAKAGFNPDQPRVPAGNPNGGQWTSGEGGTSSGANASDFLTGVEASDGETPATDFDLGALFSESSALGEATDIGEAQDFDAEANGNLFSSSDPDDKVILAADSGRRPPTGPRFPGSTPAQDARLSAWEVQADAPARAVREIDPNWRREPSFRETIEGQIAAEQAAANAARERLDLFGRLGVSRVSVRPDAPSPPHEEVLAPGGRLLGFQFGGAGQNIHTVTPPEFQLVRDQLLLGSRPIATPPSCQGLWFERADGVTFGLRLSRDHGPTIEIFSSSGAMIPNRLKVHQR